MEIKQELLQQIRKEEIPKIIDKYKKLVDEIYTQVSTPFPNFTAIVIKGDEEDSDRTITAEEQLYGFMLMRERAIDHADRMVNKINELELELNAPELFQQLRAVTASTANAVEKKTAPQPRNMAKEYATKKQ